MNIFLTIVAIIALNFTLAGNTLFAQTNKINSYLKLVAQGKIDEVKSKLPELIANFPNEPGVVLLQGVLQDDGSKAVTYYQKVLDKYPNSEWADHAAWRMIQYYAIVGDTSAAANALTTFRNKYPSFEFLAPATDAVRMATSNAKYNNSASYTKQKNSRHVPNSDMPVKTVDSAVATKQYYGLQVGIYSTLEAAESEKERFINSKLRTEIKEKLVQGEKKYAVVIGNYSSEKAAQEAKKIVEKQCKCTPLIYKK